MFLKVVTIAAKTYTGKKNMFTFLKGERLCTRLKLL